MPVHPLPSLASLPPYVFSELERRKTVARAAGHSFIDLGIGSPDQATPAGIIDALQLAATDCVTNAYPPFRGGVRLLNAATNFMSSRFGVEFAPEREAVVLAGSKEGIAEMLSALCGPGDVVLAPSLSYPVYVRSPLMHGAEVHLVPMDPARRWQLDLASIPADTLKRARVLIANYPNNPTGAVTTLADLAELVDFARRNPQFSFGLHLTLVGDGEEKPVSNPHAVRFLTRGRWPAVVVVYASLRARCPLALSPVRSQPTASTSTAAARPIRRCHPPDTFVIKQLLQSLEPEFPTIRLQT